MQQVCWSIIWIVLVLQSGQDFRTKTISTRMTLVSFAGCLVLQLLYWQTWCGGGEWFLWRLLLAMIPGVLFLAAAKVTGQIGMGDGLLVLLLGIGWPLESVLEICLTAFALAVLWFGLGFLGIVPRRERIPFVPFLCAGMGVSIL